MIAEAGEDGADDGELVIVQEIEEVLAHSGGGGRQRRGGGGVAGVGQHGVEAAPIGTAGRALDEAGGFELADGVGQATG